MAVQQKKLSDIARDIYGSIAIVPYNFWELSCAIGCSFLFLCDVMGYISLTMYPLRTWLIATIAYFCAARRWQLLSKADFLIFLSVTILYSYSGLSLIFGLLKGTISSDRLYFNISTWIITFVLLFKYLQAYFCIWSLSTLRMMLQAQPDIARVWRDNEWQLISIEQIVEGDRIWVQAGEYVPLDGVILEGASSLHEYLVTGKLTMVFKDRGDRVFAGSTNMSGSFEMYVEKIGKHTVLFKIIMLIKKAQLSKIPIFSSLDRIVRNIIIIIMLLALIISCIWFIIGPDPRLLYIFSIVLSLFCIVSVYQPLLAVSMTIIVAIEQAARMGVLIKQAQLFNLIRRIKIMVFDKTGTITYGHYKVQEFRIVDTIDEIFRLLQISIPQHVTVQSYAKAIIYAVTSLSDHGVSSAIAEYLSEYALLPKTIFNEQELEKFTVVPGLGIFCDFRGHIISIGSRKYMEQLQVSLAGARDGGSEQWAELAHTVSFIAFDTHLVAYCCVADAIREKIADTIVLLKSQGIQTVLITADDKTTANAIAQRIGIDQVLAEISAYDKAHHLRELHLSDTIVAMVGDALEDRVALEAADVGIAFCSGLVNTDKIEDVVLLHDDIIVIPKIIILAQKVVSRVYRIIDVSFMYNGIAILLGIVIGYMLYKNMLSTLVSVVIMIIFSTLFMLWGLRKHSI